jgi:two-component system, LytTR family, response regulator
MTPIRVLVVDDEKPARERLRRLLSRDTRVALAGCHAGGAEALAAIRDAAATESPVHLVFLDVQMPEVDGFAVVAQLVRELEPEAMPAIIFVTAHDAYALRAFEAHALDYLLKPFGDQRFQAALDRAIRLIRVGHTHTLFARLHALLGTDAPADARNTAPVTHQRAARPLDRIVLKEANRVRLLPVEQISWIQAEGVYVKLHTRDGKAHLQRGLLGTLDSALDENQFVRIHRSAIVNIDMVEELQQDAHGEYVVVLRDRTQVRVGRRFRSRLQARLGQSL